MMASSMEPWQPQLRLRHLQTVGLHTFSPAVPLPRHAKLFYELSRVLSDGQHQLVYVSEQIPLQCDLSWEAVDPQACLLPQAALQEPLQNALHLAVKAVTHPAAAAAAAPGQQELQQEQQQQAHPDQYALAHGRSNSSSSSNGSCPRFACLTCAAAAHDSGSTGGYCSSSAVCSAAQVPGSRCPWQDLSNLQEQQLQQQHQQPSSLWQQRPQQQPQQHPQQHANGLDKQPQQQVGGHSQAELQLQLSHEASSQGQQQQQQEAKAEERGEQLVYVRLVHGVFRVLLPQQFQLLQQQQQQQQQHHHQGAVSNGQHPAARALFDECTGFKVAVVGEGAAKQQSQQQVEPTIASANAVTAEAQPGATPRGSDSNHSSTALLSPVKVATAAVSEQPVKLQFLNGKWKLELTHHHHQQQQQQHTAPLSMRPCTPPLDAPAHATTAAAAAAAAWSPAGISRHHHNHHQQLSPYTLARQQGSPQIGSNVQQQQQQQQHAGVSALLPNSPAQLSFAGRVARHSRTSSSCSDAAQQLEQQLLGVFDAAPTAAAVRRAARHVRTSSSSSEPGLQLEQQFVDVRDARPHIKETSSLYTRQEGQPGIPAGPVISSVSNSLLSTAGAEFAGASSSSMNGLQEQQLLPGGSDTVTVARTADDVMAAAHAHTGSSSSSHSTELGPGASFRDTEATSSGHQVTKLPRSTAAAAAAAEEQLGFSSSSSSHRTGFSTHNALLLLELTFSLHVLKPIDPSELMPASGSLNPQDPAIKTNQLVLGLGSGLYTVPPPTPRELSIQGSEGLVVPEGVTPRGSAEYELVLGLDAELKGSQGSALLRRQISAGHKQPPSVVKQQQLFRWMLSNSTGILDSVDHLYEEETDLGNSSSSSALGFLGALFNRQNPNTLQRQNPSAIQRLPERLATQHMNGTEAACLSPSTAAEAAAANGDSATVCPTPAAAGPASIPAAADHTLPDTKSGMHKRWSSSITSNADVTSAATAGGSLGATAGDNLTGARHRRSASTTLLTFAGDFSAASSPTTATAASSADHPTPAAAGSVTNSPVPKPLSRSSPGTARGSTAAAAAASAAPLPVANTVNATPAAAATVAGSSSGLSLLSAGSTALSLFQTLPAAAAAVAAASAAASARGAAAAAAGVERQYEMREFTAVCKRLVHLHQRLEDVSNRRTRARQKVEGLLQRQATFQQQQAARHMAQLHWQQQAATTAARQQQLSAAVATLQDRGAELLAHCQALLYTAGALSKAVSRLGAAAAVLAGSGGVGRWKDLHGQLVARRNRLVSQLAGAFQVGPASRSPLAAAPLAQQLEVSWWATNTQDAAAELADEMSEAGITDTVAPAAAAVQQPQEFQWPSQQQQHHQPAPVPAIAAASNTQQQQQQLLARKLDAGTGDRLLVAGLELPASLAKRGLQGSMGWGGDFDEEARVAAALGYVAQMVQLLSQYLDVPLRYPLLPRSSRSSILDPAPVHQQGLEGHANRRFWGLTGFSGAGGEHGRHQGSGHPSSGGEGSGFAAGSSSSGGGGLQSVQAHGTAAAVAATAGSAVNRNVAAESPLVAAVATSSSTPVAPAAAAVEEQLVAAVTHTDLEAPLELPLYYVAGDRTRFAYAVFLLNKNLEQLLHAHGMSSYGPNQVLANLYKLMTAAASALPPQLPTHLEGHSSGSTRQQQQRQGDDDTKVAAAAAGTAAFNAGADALWLQQLPLPPSFTPQQPPPGAVQQQRQQLQQQRAAGVHVQGGKQHQSQVLLSVQQQQQQQGSGWSLWPWSRQAGNQQQQQMQPAVAQAVQQQQQQVPISTYDWNELIAHFPVQGEESHHPYYQQQQQQYYVAPGGVTYSSAAGLQQQQQQDKLRIAQEAVAAADAAAAAAAKSAAAAAASLLAQQQQQQQERPVGLQYGNVSDVISTMDGLSSAGAATLPYEVHHVRSSPACVAVRQQRQQQGSTKESYVSPVAVQKESSSSSVNSSDEDLQALLRRLQSSEQQHRQRWSVSDSSAPSSASPADAADGSGGAGGGDEASAVPAGRTKSLASLLSTRWTGDE